MQQGAIHRTRDGLDLLCVVQADLGVETAYLLCAPVLPRGEMGRLIPRLHLPLMLESGPHVVALSQLVALPRPEIGARADPARAPREALIAAIDLLVTGF